MEPKAHAGGRATGTQWLLGLPDVDDDRPDHADQPGRALGILCRDADRVNLVNETCCWVADRVVFNEQILEHGQGSADR